MVVIIKQRTWVILSSMGLAGEGRSEYFVSRTRFTWKFYKDSHRFCLKNIKFHFWQFFTSFANSLIFQYHLRQKKVMRMERPCQVQNCPLQESFLHLKHSFVGTFTFIDTFTVIVTFTLNLTSTFHHLKHSTTRNFQSHFPHTLSLSCTLHIPS